MKTFLVEYDPPAGAGPYALRVHAETAEAAEGAVGAVASDPVVLGPPREVEGFGSLIPVGWLTRTRLPDDESARCVIGVALVESLEEGRRHGRALALTGRVAGTLVEEIPAEAGVPVGTVEHYVESRSMMEALLGLLS